MAAKAVDDYGSWFSNWKLCWPSRKRLRRHQAEAPQPATARAEGCRNATAEASRRPRSHDRTEARRSDAPPPTAGSGRSRARRRRLSGSNIRVDVGLLDKMMNLVGELVLARNQILQCSSSQNDATFFNAAQRLNLITTELQEGVMKTRMQPIGNVWSRFPRLVRDLALQCGKQVTIEMEGSETELDKTIIEAIKDPLTHILRNSLDHGIEMPEDRVRAGKPPSGRLHLRAFHEGGQVNIEISDDGAGIDLERVKQQAVQRGVIGAQQAARMSDRELTQPGLPARIFHGGEGQQCLRPRRRHGRGQDQHREDRRHRRSAIGARPRHDAEDQDPA